MISGPVANLQTAIRNQSMKFIKLWIIMTNSDAYVTSSISVTLKCRQYLL